MKAIIIIGLFISLLFVIYYGFNSVKSKVKSDLATSISITPSHVISPTAVVLMGKEKKSLFVPYWSLKQNIQNVDRTDQLIYFGITPNKEGIDTTETGYRSLPKFIKMTRGYETSLTIRMVDNDINSFILKDKKLQEKIIDETIVIAEKYSFDSVILDLEVKALPFDSLIHDINSFVSAFSKKVKTKQKRFVVTLYGDTFYRLRPYEVRIIAERVDEIMIMAYDFHKARNNPGPNFPLHGKEQYGYDMTSMVDDYLAVVSPQKLTVIFGLYGYDWVVDEKGVSIQIAQPITLANAEEKFIRCTQCTVRRDTLSAESKVIYTDKNGEKHVVWYEDLRSIAKKEQFLKTKGINSFSFWAYGYDEE